MIRVGTAGWDYADWEGVVYPRPRPRGFDRLAWLARMFDAVEVNVTFYRVPSPSAAATWVRRVAANPRFRFTLKLPRSFTHERGTGAEQEDERAFRALLDPLRGAGRLGAVLAQFPQSLHDDAPGAARLESVIDRFSDLPLVVELRHAGWGASSLGERLGRLSVGFANIDQPALPTTLRPTEIVSSPIGYVRLHGRNAAEWFRQAGGPSPGAGSLEASGPARRYDYLYTREELAPWVASIRRIAEQAGDTFVITNNHFRGKAVVNALQIRAALEGTPVEAPGILVAAYPAELGDIARRPDDRLPFE